MEIEDVAEKADVWSEAIKKIVAAITAAVVALIAAVSGVSMLWSNDEEIPPAPAPVLLNNTGFGPQCSQLMSTIDHTWTEQQWTIWETLRRELGC